MINRKKSRIFLLSISLMFVILLSSCYFSDDGNKNVSQQIQDGIKISSELKVDKETEVKHTIIADENQETEIKPKKVTDEEQETEIKSKRVADKEILFRGIPWATSYTDVNKELKEFVFMDGFSYGPYSEGVLYDDDATVVCEDDYAVTIAYSTEVVNVGGYNTTEILGTTLYFANGVSGGKISKDNDNTKFYGARYRFEPKDIDSVTSEFLNKLVSLYGEASGSYEKTMGFGDKEKIYYWYGQNDTELTLISQDYEGDSEYFPDTILISYAWHGGDEILKEFDRIVENDLLKKEKEQIGNDNNNGL